VPAPRPGHRLRALSAGELRYLTEVDFRDHVGLVAVRAEAPADAARDRGVHRFVATMLPDNLAAHRVFARVASVGDLRAAGPVHEVRGEISGGRARRAGRPRRSGRAPA
jgi:hypothetical protein